MKARIVSFILKIPLVLMVISSFGASLYAAYKKISGVTWASPIILGGIIGLYLLGVYLSKSKNEETTTEKIKQCVLNPIKQGEENEKS